MFLLHTTQKECSVMFEPNLGRVSRSTCSFSIHIWHLVMWRPRRLFGLLFHFSKNCVLKGSSNEHDWAVNLTLGHDVDGLVQCLTRVSSCVVFWRLCCIAQPEFAVQQIEIWYAASSGPCSFPEVDFIYQKSTMLLLNDHECLHHNDIVHATPSRIRQAWCVVQPAESLHVEYSNNIKATIISSAAKQQLC